LHRVPRLLSAAECKNGFPRSGGSILTDECAPAIHEYPQADRDKNHAYQALCRPPAEGKIIRSAIRNSTMPPAMLIVSFQAQDPQHVSAEASHEVP
jgi:hypothetical protein